MTQFDIPIVFIIFNRPDTTLLVFEEIRRIRPRTLLIIADGPRSDRLGESEKCNMVRTIINQVDWPCDLRKNYADTNLGCKLRVSSGLDWVFEQVEEAIILEDDCLPNQSFFDFCSQLLAYYRNDERIMHIGGSNYQFGRIRGDGSYYFSRKAHVWGWATWRRAWRHYDVAMKKFSLYRDMSAIDNIIANKQLKKKLLNDFNLIHEGKIDTWDYQWTFAIYQQHALTIIPNVNLVSNIGFANEATHTLDAHSVFANVPTVQLTSIVHPTFVFPDFAADDFTFKLEHPSFFSRIIHKLRHVNTH